MANNQNKIYSTPPSSNLIITNQPIPISSVQMTNEIRVGPEPVRLICPTCRTDIQTTRRYQSTTMTHIAALLLCGLCCCCLPYCIDSCRNVDHYCPKCNSYIGTYH